MHRVAEDISHFGIIVLRAEKIYGIETYVGIEAIIVAENIQKNAFYVVVVDRSLHSKRLLSAHVQLHLRGLASARRHHANTGHLRAVQINRGCSVRTVAERLRYEIGRTSWVAGRP